MHSDKLLISSYLVCSSPSYLFSIRTVLSTAVANSLQCPSFTPYILIDENMYTSCQFYTENIYRILLTILPGTTPSKLSPPLTPVF